MIMDELRIKTDITGKRKCKRDLTKIEFLKLYLYRLIIGASMK